MSLLSLVDQIKAKRQAFSLAKTLGFGSSAHQALSSLFQEMGQKKNTSQLQVLVFDQNSASAADSVVMDAACTLYGIFTHKTTATAAWLKVSDNATTASSTAAEFMTKLAAKGESASYFPAGFALANGLTLRSDTTASGSTRSTTGDGPNGFIIFGA